MKSSDIGDLCAMSRIYGMLLVLAAMPGATITEKLAIELECAADRLSIINGSMFEKAVPKDDEYTLHFGRVYPAPAETANPDQ